MEINRIFKDAKQTTYDPTNNLYNLHLDLSGKHVSSNFEESYQPNHTSKQKLKILFISIPNNINFTNPGSFLDIYGT